MYRRKCILGIYNFDSLEFILVKCICQSLDLPIFDSDTTRAADFSSQSNAKYIAMIADIPNITGRHHRAVDNNQVESRCHLTIMYFAVRILE